MLGDGRDVCVGQRFGHGLHHGVLAFAIAKGLDLLRQIGRFLAMQKWLAGQGCVVMAGHAGCSRSGGCNIGCQRLARLKRWFRE